MAALAADGLLAVQAYETAAQEGAPFNLVLMDIQMPVMDGLDATRNIRSFEAASLMPACHVIAVTANVTTEHRREAAEAGLSDFMAKPIFLEAMRAVLQRWIDSDAAFPSPQRSADRLRRSSSTGSILPATTGQESLTSSSGRTSAEMEREKRTE